MCRPLMVSLMWICVCVEWLLLCLRSVVCMNRVVIAANDKCFQVISCLRLLCNTYALDLRSSVDCVVIAMDVLLRQRCPIHERFDTSLMSARVLRAIKGLKPSLSCPLNESSVVCRAVMTAWNEMMLSSLCCRALSFKSFRCFCVDCNSSCDVFDLCFCCASLQWWAVSLWLRFCFVELLID